MFRYVLPFLLCTCCWAQVTQPQPQKLDPAKILGLHHAAPASESDIMTDLTQQMERQQIAKMVAERHAQLLRDTDRLVALTADLNEQVAKARPNILSIDVIKKAVEIQKLAKRVEQKMKNAY